MTALTKNPMLKHNAWCQCRGCNEYFAGIEHFEYHRVNRACGTRTCLTGPELGELMVMQPSGHWRVEILDSPMSKGVSQQNNHLFTKRGHESEQG